MSSIQMVSMSKFRYKRLKPETGLVEEERERVNLRPARSSWFRFRRRHFRRRFRVKVPSLRRLWRKKARVVSAMKVSYAKVLKRFKDGQVHLGDLFAGNYLFMQVNPASLKYLEKEFSTLSNNKVAKSF
ncbi:uncharacterized protein LOC130934651 [Arachis stenosperma]|uniref:uncharacterized protein LOC130934651 n=1 Tax=Arachis stenosperma TaxID=217475 RepID=UPI0025AC9E69|nr:uncharacterized protein LOC130934651 [Arachis stenosperma]